MNICFEVSLEDMCSKGLYSPSFILSDSTPFLSIPTFSPLTQEKRCVFTAHLDF